MQAAVDGDDLAGSFAEALRHEKEIRFRLVGGRDRRFRERSVGVKLSQFRDEGIGRFVVLIRNVVFRE